MKPKVWLVLWGRSVSTRCPSKVVRDIGGVNLFQLVLKRHLQYLSPDRIVASIPEGPQDDLLARWVEEFFNIEVFRNADDGPFHMNRAIVDFFRMADQDIQLNTSPDVPFAYLEDMAYRIEALTDSGADYVESAPTGQFPIRDWEWACCPKRVWRARASRKGMEAIDFYGSNARPGPARDLWRTLVETGWNKVLLVEKPDPAKEPWPWQPLWVDEPEHFEQARLIIEELGVEGLRDRAVRKLLDDRPELKAMTANAPRRTTKTFYEDRAMVTALERIADRAGVVPQWKGWESVKD